MKNLLLLHPKNLPLSRRPWDSCAAPPSPASRTISGPLRLASWWGSRAGGAPGPFPSSRGSTAIRTVRQIICPVLSFFSLSHFRLRIGLVLAILACSFLESMCFHVGLFYFDNTFLSYADLLDVVYFQVFFICRMF